MCPTHVSSRLCVQTHTHTPPNTKAQGAAPKPGQWICWPRRGEPSEGRVMAPVPRVGLEDPHPLSCTRLCAHRGVAWRSEAGAPLCQVRGEDMGCGSQGSLMSRGCVWQASLPAGRSRCPLWSRWPQLPRMTCSGPVRVGACCAGCLASKRTLVLEVPEVPQGLFFPPWKDPVWAPFCSPAWSQKGGRAGIFTPSKTPDEQPPSKGTSLLSSHSGLQSFRKGHKESLLTTC